MGTPAAGFPRCSETGMLEMGGVPKPGRADRDDMGRATAPGATAPLATAHTTNETADQGGKTGMESTTGQGERQRW